MPPHTRESAFSCAAWDRLVNERVMPAKGGSLRSRDDGLTQPTTRPTPKLFLNPTAASVFGEEGVEGEREPVGHVGRWGWWRRTTGHVAA
jgi:hypothetical protein